MHRPRIVFLIQNLSLAGGGAERVLTETANAMHARGFDVHVAYYQRQNTPLVFPLAYGVHRANLHYISREPAPETEIVTDDGAQGPGPVRPGLIGRIKNALRPSLRGVRMARAVRRYLQAIRPDVVIPFLPPAFTATTIGALGLGIPVIASTHNAPEQDFDNPLKYSGNPIDMWLRFNVLRLVDRILVLLPEYRDYYPSEMQRKISVVPNPVRAIAPPSGAERENSILAVGRLTTVKRFDVLVRAWAPLAAKYPNWGIDIWGIGPEQAVLEQLIAELGVAESVRLRGYTTEIQNEYFTHAWLAHPAEYEGFPLAVTEALSMGLPVIGFADCSGLNRLVHDGENGLLVDPGTDRVAALSAALDRALSDAALASRLAANGPSSVAQYAPESVYGLWEDVILNTIGKDRPAARVEVESVA